MKCIAKYGKPARPCRFAPKWYYRNPQTGELEGPYCGHHAKQFEPDALRMIEMYPQLAGAQAGEAASRPPAPGSAGKIGLCTDKIGE